MSVLITGGAGFVGLNLAQHLLAQGGNVVLFGPAGPPPATLASLQAQAPGRLIIAQGDVRSAGDLDAAIVAHNVFDIVHGAAVTADIDREKRDARGIVEVNLIGTIEVLEAALRHDIRRTVQLGTGSIFGAAGNLTATLDESSSPAIPESLYGISKYAAERVGLRYRTTRGLNLSIVRLGMVFGRWEYATGVRDTLSLPLQLMQFALAGGHAVIPATTGDDWVYATDVAQGLAAMLALDHSPEPIYHLSAGTRWSIPAWCEKLRQHYPGFSFALSEQLAECNVARNKAGRRAPMNIDRIKRDADYQPRYLQDAAFDDYIRWYSTQT